ncbi:hypothetical protein [Clostridium kluyveri]|uniref:hypothetical protein n=1 Tax=Clostridium kluyveri TaxID=1534 RepID=UPI000A819658|nr:hypothetical protein [Clostridium kluyveri]UZQ51140.1 hypothetical protein OP486_02880 [Clostridium kluyveri]
MERDIQFVAKNNRGKWMLWIQIDGKKVLLTNTLSSEEEAKSFIKSFLEKPINLIE